MAAIPERVSPDRTVYVRTGGGEGWTGCAIGPEGGATVGGDATGGCVGVTGIVTGAETGAGWLETG